MAYAIRFHLDFLAESGKHSQRLADFPYLKDYDLRVFFAAFLKHLLEESDLDGKNKESFKNDDGAILRHAAVYQKYQVWHYHIGPYESLTQFKTPPSLPVNLKGAVSGAVVHYRKFTDPDTILIIGVSPLHEPFPDGDDKSLPIKRRITTPENSKPYPP